MTDLEFEWDPAKEASNQRKHGISFAEAKTVFWDDYALRIFDPDHSDGEERFLILGVCHTLRLLVVCHCYRADDAIVRIISARKANSHEAKQYWSRR